MFETVERVTFENHAKRRQAEARNAWERRAAEAAKAAEKNRCARSWLCTLTYFVFMVFGASIAMTAVFFANGDYGSLMSSLTVCFSSMILGLMLADKVER